MHPLRAGPQALLATLGGMRSDAPNLFQVRATRRHRIVAGRACRYGKCRSLTRSSANILFNDLGRPHASLAWVVSCFPKRAALPQDVPALVELYLNGCQPIRLGGVESSFFEQVVLLFDKAFYMSQNACIVSLIVHDASL